MYNRYEKKKNPVIFRSVFLFGRVRTTIQVGSTGFFSLWHLSICPQSSQPLSFFSVSNVVSQIIHPISVYVSIRCFVVKDLLFPILSLGANIMIFLLLLLLFALCLWRTCMEAKFAMWQNVKRCHQMQICKHDFVLRN